ncbi:hypothetical protein C8J57DRAFT_1492721 [Mycena rebaudengoi]|nr:hypothetical protein C8J57DRAFT_1492721 [Mycena rebaudengoi]
MSGKQKILLVAPRTYLGTRTAECMDKTTQAALLNLRQRFIAEDAFGLNDLNDGIARLLPNTESSAWKVWSAHSSELGDAYEHIIKPPLYTDLSGQPVNAFDQLTGGAQRDGVRAQRKLETSGVLPANGDVGPIRSAKSIFAARIASRKKEFEGRNGRKPNFLADECVIPGKYTVVDKTKGTTKDQQCNWCIACDKKATGHDPICIKNHAHIC